MGKLRMESLGNVVSTWWKTGRYSPARLIRRRRRALVDRQLSQLQGEIEKADLRLSELLLQAQCNQGGDLWTSLQRIYLGILHAQESGSRVDQQYSLHELGTLIHAGGEPYTTWREVFDTLQKLRDLTYQERRRHMQIRQTVTVEQVGALTRVIGAVVRRHVKDPAIMAAIAAELRIDPATM